MQGSINPSTRNVRVGKLPVAVLAALAMAVPASAQACENAGVQPSRMGVAKTRSAVLCLINQQRRAHGVGKLRDDRRLERAAQAHSASMDKANYFSHNSPGGSSPVSRIQSTGYTSGASSWGVAENIRWGSGGWGSAKVAVAKWMASPPHREAMLSRAYRQVGVGVVIGSPTGGGERNSAIYTTAFGYRH